MPQDGSASTKAAVRADSGSRTAIFAAKQYEAVLGSVQDDAPENISAVTCAAWKERTAAFLELLRWSGMALRDAVPYRPEIVAADVVLRYRRQKTGELAAVRLRGYVVTLLCNVPLEKDSIGENQPFSMRNFTPHSDTVTRRKPLMKLFVQPRIPEVRDALGKVRSGGNVASTTMVDRKMTGRVAYPPLSS